MPAPDFNLCLTTDRRSLPPGRTLEDLVRAALAGGLRAIQLREKDLSCPELLQLAERLRRLTADAGARLLINDRIDVALAVAADGVHLGGKSLPAAVARRLLGSAALIGVSTHHLAEIVPAAAAGADYLTFSPIFHTPSKAGFGPPQGLDKLRCACAQSPLPVFALGGIHAAALPEILAAGAAGVAVISAIQNAANPALSTRALLAQLDCR